MTSQRLGVRWTAQCRSVVKKRKQKLTLHLGMQVMSPPYTVTPSYVAPSFKVSANVVTLWSCLKNKKSTRF